MQRPLKPTLTDIDDLARALPFVTNSRTNCLYIWRKLKMFQCMDVDVLKWWSNHEEKLPQWSQVCKNVLLQPSSAAAERVFSILESSFNKKQTHSLQDYICASVMLQYNNRK